MIKRFLKLQYRRQAFHFSVCQFSHLENKLVRYTSQSFREQQYFFSGRSQSCRVWHKSITQLRTWKRQPKQAMTSIARVKLGSRCCSHPWEPSLHVRGMAALSSLCQNRKDANHIKNNVSGSVALSVKGLFKKQFREHEAVTELLIWEQQEKVQPPQCCGHSLRERANWTSIGHQNAKIRQVWWPTRICHLSHRRQKQEDCKFEARLGYTERCCVRQKNYSSRNR